MDTKKLLKKRDKKLKRKEKDKQSRAVEKPLEVHEEDSASDGEVAG